jgi:hypothetical protein
VAGLLAAGFGGYSSAGSAISEGEMKAATKLGNAATTQYALDEATDLARAAQSFAGDMSTISTITNFATPWAQLTESYIRYHDLKPMDWTNAVGATLSAAASTGVGAKHSFTDRFAASSLGFGGRMLAAGVIGIGPTIEQTRHPQRESNFNTPNDPMLGYITNAVGQEVGQFIASYVSDTLNGAFAEKSDEPRVYDPRRQVFVDAVTKHEVRLGTGTDAAALRAAADGNVEVAYEPPDGGTEEYGPNNELPPGGVASPDDQSTDGDLPMDDLRLPRVHLLSDRLHLDNGLYPAGLDSTPVIPDLELTLPKSFLADARDWIDDMKYEAHWMETVQNPFPPGRDARYKVNTFDTWASIAYSTYGTSQAWRTIADSNPNIYNDEMMNPVVGADGHPDTGEILLLPHMPSGRSQQEKYGLRRAQLAAILDDSPALSDTEFKKFLAENFTFAELPPGLNVHNQLFSSIVGRATEAPTPPELITALRDYADSPIGAYLLRTAMKQDHIVNFIAGNAAYENPRNLGDRSPAKSSPEPGASYVYYDLDAIKTEALYHDKQKPGVELGTMTLPVVIAHEMGHTALARDAFDLGAITAASTNSVGAQLQAEELRTTVLFENTYRAWKGLPLRKTYFQTNDVERFGLRGISDMDKTQ